MNKKTQKTTSHFIACNLCEAICGLEVKTTTNRIESIRGNPHDILSRGYMCPKGLALQDVYEDPKRLRQPMRRLDDKGEAWEVISWDEAIQFTAQNLIETQQKFGTNSFATYLGNPNVHNYGALTHGPAALSFLKTKNRYSATSVDQLPHQLICHWLYGHPLLVPVPDLAHTEYLLILGANPLASNGSMMSAPNMQQRLNDLQNRNGQYVVLDPRRTETAKHANAHHLIRPNSDAAFLLCLLNIFLQPSYLNTKKNQNKILAKHTLGLENIKKHVEDFTPENIADTVGISAENIQKIADDFWNAKRAACYGRMGVSTQKFGTLCQWAIQAINLVTGNLDQVGGMLFPEPAVDLVKRKSPNGKPVYGDFHSRVSGLPSFAGELPVAALLEEITTPGTGQIRALFVAAGNPVLSTPNGEQLSQALAGLDFMVAMDFYVNETTRHAHIILPPTHYLAHDHYDLIFHHFAVRNTARFSSAVFPKNEDERHDWEIYEALGNALADGLGEKRKFMLNPKQHIEMLMEYGQYKLKFNEVLQSPHGVDLGALRPTLPGRLCTADHNISLDIPEVLAEIPRLKSFLNGILENLENKALVLIGRRNMRSNNSWMHNLHRLTKGKPRDQLWIHPEDAARLGLEDGERVVLRAAKRTDSEKITVTLLCTQDIAAGVVSLPHGWSHASYNAIIGNDIDAVSGNAALNGQTVILEKINTMIDA